MARSFIRIFILICFCYKFVGVDCNANPRHKQVLSNPAPRSRGIPKYLEKYIFYKQAEENIDSKLKKLHNYYMIIYNA
ncbi:hypothetical protein YYE_00520 [Plasmodium vinckei vinckei]|nr:hypothetical protein YYE_00520 [Plasmodium vinckei vinckei]